VLVIVVICDKPAVIEAVLALDRVCYYWSITLDPERALCFAGQCQEMNAANRLVLTDLIQRTNAYLPRIDFGPTNPNTGQMHHDFVVGAANSRFVDVKIHKSYLRQWAAQDWQTLGNFLSLLGQELYADLARVIEEDAHDYVFSFWWDESTVV
jgi:hypothetical protein